MITKKEAEYNNQISKFWLYEKPEVFSSGKNCFRYYPKAERLTVHLPDYTDKDGVQRMGKGVSVNLTSLADEPEILDKIIDIFSGLKV